MKGTNDVRSILLFSTWLATNIAMSMYIPPVYWYIYMSSSSITYPMMVLIHSCDISLNRYRVDGTLETS